VHLYEGNPYYLQSITTLIKDVFSGRVEDFLAEDSLILTSEIKTLLDAVWEKLTEEEKAIVQQLYQVKQAMSREQLKQRLALSSSNVIQGLQSLARRYVLQVIPEENIMYRLDTVFQEYLDSIVIN
jgi:DNA-directed RNA polymerase specialized sigma subunit